MHQTRDTGVSAMRIETPGETPVPRIGDNEFHQFTDSMPQVFIEKPSASSASSCSFHLQFRDAPHFRDASRSKPSGWFAHHPIARMNCWRQLESRGKTSAATDHRSKPIRSPDLDSSRRSTCSNSLHWWTFGAVLVRRSQSATARIVRRKRPYRFADGLLGEIARSKCRCLWLCLEMQRPDLSIQ